MLRWRSASGAPGTWRMLGAAGGAGAAAAQAQAQAQERAQGQAAPEEQGGQGGRCVLRQLKPLLQAQLALAVEQPAGQCPLPRQRRVAGVQSPLQRGVLSLQARSARTSAWSTRRRRGGRSHGGRGATSLGAYENVITCFCPEIFVV